MDGRCISQNKLAQLAGSVRSDAKNDKKNAGNSFVQELIRQPQIFIKGSASEL